MNADVLKGQWHQLKGSIKSKWGKLTDDDLDQVSGNAETLIGRIQERYGYARDQAKREVDDFFAILRLTARSYFDLGVPGRSVLALRGSFGTEPSNNVANIPPSKLFYAGGGGSVRGFVYQSAGPRDAFNNPLGGASIVEGSIEFRQRIGKSFGAVAFIDAGSAYTDTLPNFSEFAPRVGTGVGVRYYTDFGPARLDVGFPLNPRPGDAPFGLYVSIGQAF